MPEAPKTENPKEKLRWTAYLFCCWPLAMVLIGGAIGGALGALAAMINVKIFRSEFKPFQKYLYISLISFISVILWLVLSTLIMLAIHSK